MLNIDVRYSDTDVKSGHLICSVFLLWITSRQDCTAVAKKPKRVLLLKWYFNFHVLLDAADSRSRCAENRAGVTGRDFRRGEEERGGSFPQNGRVFLPAIGGSAPRETVFQFQCRARTHTPQACASADPGINHTCPGWTKDFLNARTCTGGCACTRAGGRCQLWPAEPQRLFRKKRNEARGWSAEWNLNELEFNLAMQTEWADRVALPPIHLHSAGRRGDSSIHQVDY